MIPTCLALILCDRVGRKSGTRKATPVGVFHTFELRRFPGRTPPFTIWVLATNGAGSVRMRLIFERALPEEPNFEEILTVPFTMPFRNSNVTAEHEAVFENGIDLPDEGLYRVRLDSDRTTILSRYFLANWMP